MMKKEEFMQFALGTQTATDDEKYFKVIQGGITYIMHGDFSGANIWSDYRNKAEILGFVYGGKFYSRDFRCREYDLDFFEELKKFEDRFHEEYEAVVKSYSVENLVPVTEKSDEYKRAAEDLDYYRKYQAHEDAKRDLFGIKYKTEKRYSKEEFTPIFFDCLKKPENFQKYIAAKIEKGANVINYSIMREAEKIKAMNELKKDNNVMHLVAIYQVLSALDVVTVKLYCKIYGQDFELKCDREALMRDLAFNKQVSLYNFTNTVAEKIKEAAAQTGIKRHNAELQFTDIKKITHGKKTIFEEA